MLFATPIAPTRSILSTKSTRSTSWRRILLLSKHFYSNVAFSCIFLHILALSRKILTNHALNSRITFNRAEYGIPRPRIVPRGAQRAYSGYIEHSRQSDCGGPRRRFASFCRYRPKRSESVGCGGVSSASTWGCLACCSISASGNGTFRSAL